MKKNNLFFILLLFVFISFAAEAQQTEGSCAITLINARKLYDDGAIEKVPGLLQACLQNGFKREEKIQAYRLLVLTYLFSNNKPEAEKNMVSLLKTDPEYQIDPAIDPPEFIKLYETYRTLPLYTIGGFAGTNTSQINVLQAYSIGNTYGTYKSNYGFQAGLSANRYLFNHCYLSLNAMYFQNKFTYTNVINRFNDVKSIETQSWIILPLTATYEMEFSNWRPFIRLGGSWGLLLNDKSTMTRQYDNQDPEQLKPAPQNGPQIDLRDQRIRTSYWLVTGAGVKWKQKKNIWLFDLRYNIGFANQVNTSTRLAMPEVVAKYQYIDSDFSLSNITLSVGYNYSLYKPKKKKLKD